MPEPTSDTPVGSLIIKFLGDRLSVKDFEEHLMHIRIALQIDEEEELSRICNELEIADFVKDAVLYRLDKSNLPRLYVTSINKGSIEFVAIIAATIYYFLDKTLSESIKAGYLSSKVHDLLKSRISSALDAKLERLSKSIFFDKSKLDLRTKTIYFEVNQQEAVDSPPTFEEILSLPPPPPHNKET